MTEVDEVVEGKHATLAGALVAAQSEAPAVKRDGTNPHFSSSFTTLDHLLAKVRPVLNKHGIALVQMPSESDGHPTLITRLIHENGESIESTMPLLLTKNDPQGLGSSLTYARRYALAAALGISDQDDDDGNAGSGEHDTAAPPKGAASEKQRAFLTKLLKDAKLAGPEKALVNDWLKGNQQVWQKQPVSEAITWIKDDQVTQLLQAAGATESDLPAPDTDGLEPVTDPESGVTF